MFFAATAFFSLVSTAAVGQQADPSNQLIVSVGPAARWTATQLVGYVNSGETRRYGAEVGNPVAAGFVSAATPSSHVSDNLKGEYAHLGTYVLLTYATQKQRDIGYARATSYPPLSGIQINEGVEFSLVPDDILLYNPDFYGLPNTNYAWQFDATRIWGAWSYGRGFLRVGIADHAPDALHPDLDRSIASASSYDFRLNQQSLVYVTTLGVHGSMVAGIAAARSNNPASGGSTGQGLAGACPACQLSIAAIPGAEDRVARGLLFLAENGSSVINLSAGANSGHHAASREPIDPTGIPCQPSFAGPAEHVWCPAIRLMRRRDALFLAAAGNYKSRSYLETGEPASLGHFGVQWPARDPMAVAVGGSDLFGARWDELNYIEPWDNQNTGCPIVYSENGSNSVFKECGSNFGNDLDFLMPSREVVSTVRSDTFYASVDWCSDAAFAPAADGYARCNGTSFSAPQLAGSAALLRSINPLVRGDDLVEVLRTSAGGVFSFDRGWGIPQLEIAANQMRARVGGALVVNRLTPLFALTNQTEGDRLYTSSPQIATAAFVGDLYTQPTVTTNCDANWVCRKRPYLLTDGFFLPRRTYSLPDTIDPNGDVWGVETIAGYLTPRANILVFTGENSPYAGVSLKPLHRLVFRQSCDPRNTAYASEETGSGSVRYFLGSEGAPPKSFCSPMSSASYTYEGIEGYLLASCPSQFGSCTDYSDLSKPQPIYLRYSNSEARWALVPGYLTGAAKFQTYTNSVGPNSGLLGYAFVNFDADWDGVADGFERTIGLDWKLADSDCDGNMDGDEFPLSSVQASTSDPLGSPGCSPQATVTVATSLISTPSQGVQRLSVSATATNPAGGQSIGNAQIYVRLLNAANVSGCTLVPLPPIGGAPYAPREVRCSIGTLSPGTSQSTTFTVDVTTDAASDEVTARYAGGVVRSEP